MKHKGSKFVKRRLSKNAVREKLYDSRFLIPTIVTLGNMFFGFMSIIYATSGFYEKAAWAIIIAMIFDGCDGRVARSFKATSKFGLELDSLSDLVSFGVAPAILIYQWCFKETADEFGVIVCFAYCIGAAARLARFNITECNLKSFEGLPSPAGAGFVAAIVWFLGGYIPREQWELCLAAILMVAVGYLMISKISYFSLKQLKLKRIPFHFILLAGVAIAFAWYRPRMFALVLFVGYAFSGLITSIIHIVFGCRKGCCDDECCTISHSSENNSNELVIPHHDIVREGESTVKDEEEEKKDFTLV